MAKGKQRATAEYEPLAAGWEAVIGVECHIQLKTSTKLFSSAPSASSSSATQHIDDGPNSRVVPFDAALPGSLPRLTREPVTLALKACIAMGCTLENDVGFDRKHYFYPDLPSGYQITQRYAPLARDGRLRLRFDEGYLGDVADEVEVRIEQVQLEQDTAKSTHHFTSSQQHQRTFVDVDRAGQPLIEVVSGPDMRKPEQAGAYVRKLREVVRRIGASDGNMDEGSLRCDVNVSVHRIGEPWGTRCEVKNLNSVRFVMNAAAHEMHRQQRILAGGGTVEQETRAYDEVGATTYRLRSKEQSPDYRYMPDANLAPLAVAGDERLLDEVRASMPELPDEQRSRLLETYGLPARDINVLMRIGLEDEGAVSSDDDVSAVAFFEQVAQGRDARVAINWTIQELLKALNSQSLAFRQNPVSAEHLGELIDVVESGQATMSTARKLVESLVSRSVELKKGQRVLAYLEQQGALALNSAADLGPLCQEAVEALPSEAEAVKEGKIKAVERIVGQVMKLAKGRADANATRKLLLEMLK
ncbi:Glutamyl-tRNA amidotransferase B subunit [Acaromyces ingoldii]|uniref:Glutamyl-tRNA(Gln) amidotransferase subunit B, mitochondrial n=1 Tax=Acaromyces ingoldii TaxID=215250 RepID=A0A316YKV5_9BASI|nr:Glutamyl-tRNA amidotransferase B subunit [Acaromyces ingoldii]PWN89832.1 Glutamyl-tRNA amidotransferase B subunit [Acaromyces ingoldii]